MKSKCKKVEQVKSTMLKYMAEQGSYSVLDVWARMVQERHCTIAIVIASKQITDEMKIPDLEC